MLTLEITDPRLIDHIEEQAERQSKSTDSICQEVLLKCMDLKLIETLGNGKNSEEWGFGSRR